MLHLLLFLLHLSPKTLLQNALSTSRRLDFSMQNGHTISSPNLFLPTPLLDLISPDQSTEFIASLRAHNFAIVTLPSKKTPTSILPKQIRQKANTMFATAPLSSLYPVAAKHPTTQPYASIGLAMGGSNSFLDTRFSPSSHHPDLTDNLGTTLTDCATLLAIVGEASLREVSREVGVPARSLLSLSDLSPLYDHVGADDAVSNTVMRLASYPGGDDAKVTFGSHTDTTFFTIIPVASTEGLQVYSSELGGWVDVEGSGGGGGSNRIVVMGGDLLQIFTEGVFQAACHRVKTPAGPRISSPYLMRHRKDRVSEQVWKAMQFGSETTDSMLSALASPTPPSSLPIPINGVDIRDRFRSVSAAKMWLESRGYNRVSVHSTAPLVAVVDSLLSSANCQALLTQVRQLELRPSTVVDEGQENRRTSLTGWIGAEDSSELRTLCAKLAELVGVGVDHAENFLAAVYGEGKEYKLHLDHVDEMNAMQGGGRMVSCIVYLNGEEEGVKGGYTSFPRVGVEVRPKRGRVVLFENVQVPVVVEVEEEKGMVVEELSAHAGGKVGAGEEKVILTMWFHPKRIREVADKS